MLGVLPSLLAARLASRLLALALLAFPISIITSISPMNTANNVTHNATVPQTIGALLTEENTIDPLSHLPSFLELTFVDVARNSGRVALSAAWDMVVVYLKGSEERLTRLEQMMIYKVANLRLQRNRSSNLAAITRVAAAAIARMRLCYYTRLRRICYVVTKALESLAPELQSLVMFAIDYHCIHYLAGSTGCEMVYGLKRSKVVNTRQSNAVTEKRNKSTNQQGVIDLTSSDKTRSAALAALIPYWKERCDKFYTNLNEQPRNIHSRNSTPLAANIDTQKLKDSFIKLYPYLHFVHEGSVFLYQFAYLMEYTPYWSFSLHGLGVILRRITVADVQRKDIKQQPPQSSQTQTSPVQSSPNVKQNGSRIGTLTKQPLSKLTVSNILRGAFIFSVSYTLVSGWCSYFQRELSLRRRRWIAGEDNFSQSQMRRQGNVTNDERDTQQRIYHPIPPPPLPPIKLKHVADQDSAQEWVCPLCQEPRINPTASTSGYVFCYKCLLLKLRRDGELCPLTGMPCKESQVVRLYESTYQRESPALKKST